MSEINYPQTVRHPDYQERQSEAVYRGKHRLVLPGGHPVTIDQADISSLGFAITGTGETEVQLIVAQTEEENGLYLAMTPARARSMARELGQLADEVEAKGRASWPV